MWGAGKEIAAAGMLGLVGVPSATAIEGNGNARAIVPLALASGATLAILSFGGALWLAPLLLATLVFTVRAYGPRVATRRMLAFVLTGAALALPSLLKAKQFLSPNSGTLTSANDLGNLIKPLDWLQFFGIWP